MSKLTPVQEKIVKEIAQYEREYGELPGVVEVSLAEKKEAEKFLALSQVEVKVKNGTTNYSTSN